MVFQKTDNFMDFKLNIYNLKLISSDIYKLGLANTCIPQWGKMNSTKFVAMSNVWSSVSRCSLPCVNVSKYKATKQINI